MWDLYWRIAESENEVHRAQRVRWKCLIQQLDIDLRVDGKSGFDVSPFDGLVAAHHVLVYHRTKPVGAARLLRARPVAASAQGPRYGFELEARVDLGSLPIAPEELGEVARLGVLTSYRGAAAKLYEGLYAQSRLLGIRYWIGAVDCQTCDGHQAARVAAELKHRNLMSPRFFVRPWSNEEASQETSSSAQCPPRRSATETLGLPQPIRAFVARLNARVVGAPVRHSYFPRYVIPMLVDLEEIPASTLARFDASTLSVGAALKPLHAALVRVARDAVRRLDMHPVGSMLVAGKLSRAQYASYLIQVVHQVKDSAPMLARAADRLEQLGRPRLAALFRRKALEEDGHDAWALADLAAVGVSSEQALATPRCSAVRAYSEWLHYCADATPTGLLGLAFLLEWFGRFRAALAAENLSDQAVIPNISAAVRFLRGHGEADVGHIRALSEPLAEITDADEAKGIVLSAQVTANLYLGLLEHAGKQPDANRVSMSEGWRS